MNSCILVNWIHVLIESLCLSLSVCLSVRLSPSVSLFVSLWLALSVCLSLCLSLSICFSISVSLSRSLSVSLSVFAVSPIIIIISMCSRSGGLYLIQGSLVLQNYAHTLCDRGVWRTCYQTEVRSKCCHKDQVLERKAACHDAPVQMLLYAPALPLIMDPLSSLNVDYDCFNLVVLHLHRMKQLTNYSAALQFDTWRCFRLTSPECTHYEIRQIRSLNNWQHLWHARQLIAFSSLSNTICIERSDPAVLFVWTNWPPASLSNAPDKMECLAFAICPG